MAVPPSVEKEPAPPPPPLAEEPAPPPVRSSDEPKDWTDTRVVAKLAESCDYVPHVDSSDQGWGGDENIFACALPFEQTCFPSECDTDAEGCKHKCEATCTSCSAGCTSRCGACAAQCKGAACRLACAQKTAECKETCGHAMDHCGTAGCASAQTACNAAADHFWATNRCESRCGVFRVCKGKCGEGATACVKGCEEIVAPGYAACVQACSHAPGGAAGQQRCARACKKSHPCAPDDCTRGEAGLEGEGSEVALTE